MDLVASAANEGEGALLCQVDKLLERVTVNFEPGAIAFPELVPPFRIVAKPFAQCGARRYLLRPEIDRRPRL